VNSVVATFVNGFLTATGLIIAERPKQIQKYDISSPKTTTKIKFYVIMTHDKRIKSTLTLVLPSASLLVVWLPRLEK